MTYLLTDVDVDGVAHEAGRDCKEGCVDVLEGSGNVAETVAVPPD